MKLHLIPVVFALVIPLAACNASNKASDSLTVKKTQVTESSPSTTVQSASPNVETSPNTTNASSNWYSYSSAQGNYTTKFPGKPNEHKQTAQLKQGTISEVEALYVDKAKQRLYLTRQVDLPFQQGVKLSNSNIEKILDNGETNTVKTSGATVKAERKISQSGYPGREFTMLLPNGTAAQARIFVSANNYKAYQAVVAAKDGKLDFPETQIFLDSLNINK
ncbi:MAG: hypothetical protein NVS2B14_07570 [Chamaesiphon sp.]